MYVCVVSTQILSSTTLFNINNKIFVLKRLCDTEDWSNGCWKFIFASQGWIIFKNIFKQKAVILNDNNISQYYYFNQINAALVSISYLKKKSYWPQSFKQ